MLGQTILKFPIWPLNTKEVKSCLHMRRKCKTTINTICIHSKKDKDVSQTFAQHLS